jgi:iron complex outermembrane receptor protein
MGSTNSAGFFFAAIAAPLLAISLPLEAAEDSSDQPLVEIVVTATLRSIPLEEMPGSVTVLSARALHDAGQEHFEDIVALVPNLNWAGDTSRPRYFQIRGIGELQQYQGAPNPSVAFLIDDIDFSGLGSAATLFDVDHIEVLHGPQGTLYGANALAGLIYVRSAEPSDAFGGRAEFDVGDYNERSYGAVLTGPVSDLDSAFRLAVERYTSDGFYHNAYLGRSNTGARDELTLRGKWRYEPNEAWRVDLTLLRAQIDNGYDAFAIDNSRTTESDHPGVDGQYSTGLSARTTYTGFAPATLTTIATYADTTVNYGFDGDWGNPQLWAPYTDDFTEYQARHRSTRSLEIRLGDAPRGSPESAQGSAPDSAHGAAPGSAQGFSWLFGVYAFELRESLSDTSAGIYLDPFDATQNLDSLTVISSEYRSRNGAVFTQLDGDIWGASRWSLGLRGERHTSSYNDTTTNLDAPTTANSFGPAENLWGGHASLDSPVADGQHVYALIARGYKASGFNLSPGLPANQLLFGAESDLNLEVGHKAQIDQGRLRIDTSLFYMVRHNEQLLTGEQLDPSNPNTFIFYTGNARSGYNYGLESTFEWAATRSLQFGGSLGLLQTQYHGFVQNGVVLPDRALPHAPPWQAAINATWRSPSGLFARLDVTGMGAFFYDLPPNWTRSNAYGLINSKLGWGNERWEAYLWGRNLLDKNYTVRGFYFGDEPPDFPNKLYTQLGEPRNWGVHFTIRFPND